MVSLQARFSSLFLLRCAGLRLRLGAVRFGGRSSTTRLLGQEGPLFLLLHGLVQQGPVRLVPASLCCYQLPLALNALGACCLQRSSQLHQTVLVHSHRRSSSFRVAVLQAACTLKCIGDLHEDMMHSGTDRLLFEENLAAKYKL